MRKQHTKAKSENFVRSQTDVVDKLIDNLTLFDASSHIIYVNRSYRGDDIIGKLMADFHQSDTDKMHYRKSAD